MIKALYVLVVAVILCAAPAFAQGPFADVPTDHWAYDAVNTLQNNGIVIGYPDGTYGGKRPMTRYEFAVAIARLWQFVEDCCGEDGDGGVGNFITREDLNQALSEYAKKSDVPGLGNYATKADLDAVRRLVDEFRDEIAALGVDVDAMKRDIAALSARVDALEAMVKRVQFYGNFNTFAIATSSDAGSDANPVDLDQRIIATDVTDTFSNSLTVVNDFDLSVVGRVSDRATANATINFGNYLNYLGAVDDYANGIRPSNRNEVVDVGDDIAQQFGYDFYPYYLYLDAGLGAGSLTAGRFPLQLTPYTLKKIDVDSYTSIMKTDSGNYPMDGLKLGINLFGVDWTWFAVKHDLNDYLANGLTGQPRAGLYGLDDAGTMTFHDLGGHAVGGLDYLMSQSAGVRAQFGIGNGNLGATYYQSYSEEANLDLAGWDQARVWGADLSIPFGSFGIAASYTQSDTLERDGAGVADIDDDNTAWDVKGTFALGNLDIDAGYKEIERNFAAAGAWDKIGRWTNPTNVKGPYVGLTYPLGSKLRIVAKGEFLEMIDDLPGGIVTNLNGYGLEGDEVFAAEAGLEYGMSSSNSLALGYQWVRYDPDSTGLDKGTEEYITIGWAHQFSQNAGMKIGYQFIDWDGGDDSVVYGADYEGNLGVVQFGVSF